MLCKPEYVGQNTEYDGLSAKHTWLDEYVKDYDAVSLWEVYFKRLPKLAGMIERRGISGLDELEYGAVEYFERYVPKSLSGVQGKATTKEQKPLRQTYSAKQRQHILSGG